MERKSDTVFIEQVTCFPEAFVRKKNSKRLMPKNEFLFGDNNEAAIKTQNTWYLPHFATMIWNKLRKIKLNLMTLRKQTG